MKASISAGTEGIWRNQHQSEKLIKHFKGKCRNHLHFNLSVLAFGYVLGAVLVLGSFVCGFCEEISLVSVPLGFEISGFDKRNWVSENGVFACGFLSDYQKDGFVVGIWYNFGNRGAVPDMLPVWTVGGGIRVSQNSSLQLSMDGSLALFDNLSGLLVWSSNTSSLGVQTASLLNTGNLVLMGSGQEVVWESFHRPTDTLLPGQSLHFPQALQAPSANSAAGYYSFQVRSSGEVVLVWDSNVTYWRSHLSPSIVATEARFESNGVFGLFDETGKIVWYRSSKDFRDPSVVFRLLRIDPDGNLRIYSWDDALHLWKVGWQAVENQCSVFGSCGLYSICGYNSTGPICECLVQDSMGWDTANEVDFSSYGCKKMVDLDNCKTGISMMSLKQTVLYGLYPPHDVDVMLSAEACKRYCLNDSSCFAATAKNDGSGLCTIKRTSFISGYRFSYVPATSFMKVCLAPQAVSTQEAKLHNNPEIPLLQPSLSGVDDHKGFGLAVAVLFFITASVFLTIEIFIFWIVYRKRQVQSQMRAPFLKDARMDPHYSAVIRLSFEEVRQLTNNFKTQLGPTVFKGALPNKMPVVAKVLKNVVASEKDFRMIFSTLASTHHKNLVALKGFCFEPNHEILIFEYISYSSLDQWLFNTRQIQQQGSWQKRLDIAVGIARAIAYLHLECQQCIAHGNLKLENILLDEQLVAKVTDFGLQGLMEKEDASSSETLPERDVYRFGEMLLQIVMAKRDVLRSDVFSLAYEMCRDQKLGEVSDIELEGRIEWAGVERVVRIAFWCMQDQPFLRPSIGEVVKVLEGSLHVDTPPMRSAFEIDKNQTAERDIDAVEGAI
ncbi:G-type lectin S-receptor-like serine/threonine-protein kinase SD3-1 [Cinnamomum micranthum f. kanehirae]|uniref:Receptor-like serine/threonine-protein kinase n=1 Tax=Cinnamomum micranthum f. kanehirae TaxID=337451 RepID=A0A443N5D8_9MAGN|nr:G-type lectin S-receptor-like serine/threonine-protein kinase SD3-1 [Cinnamomum micranthum f. kanehirae]